MSAKFRARGDIYSLFNTRLIELKQNTHKIRKDIRNGIYYIKMKGCRRVSNPDACTYTNCP